MPASKSWRERMTGCGVSGRGAVLRMGKCDLISGEKMSRATGLAIMGEVNGCLCGLGERTRIGDPQDPLL